MTKDELWKIYTDRNPQFSGEERFTISPEGLKKLFDQTWDQATKAAKENRRSNDALWNSLFKQSKY